MLCTWHTGWFPTHVFLSCGLVVSQVLGFIISFEEWGDVGQILDTRINAYMASTTPRKKYMVELLLRVPLLYLMHMFFMLSPSSDHFLVEFVLCLLRYVGAFLLLGCWGQSVNTLFTIYTQTIPSMFIAWMMEKVYWTFLNTAKGVCHDVWLPWKQDTWLTPVKFTGVLQVAQLLHLFKILKIDRAWTVVIGLYHVPYIFCSFDIFLYFLAPIQYWFSKVAFCVCLYKDVTLVLNVRLYCDSNDPRQRLEFPNIDDPLQLIRHIIPLFIQNLIPMLIITIRNVFALFGVFYYFFCVLFDLMFIYNMAHVCSLPYLSSCIGMWCTSLVVVCAVGAMGAVVSNAAAALFLKLIRGEPHFFDIMNSTLGHLVNVTITSYCIDAGILSVYEEVRISKMNIVLLLSLYAIFMQIWIITENQFLSIVYSGEGNRWLAFLRVLFFSIILLTIPTLFTVYFSPQIGVDAWLMLHLSGNAMMLIRAAIVFVEILLVSCTWFVDNGLDRLEDAIYYTRVFKTAAVVICDITMSYYRFYAPFFDTRWVVRAIIVIPDITVRTYTLCKMEWDVFQAKHRLTDSVSRLPDASVEELTKNDDVCSVCLETMTNAKKLPCSHTFHVQCLRKWFQVNRTCPNCRSIQDT